MAFAAGAAHDVLDVIAAHQQGVGDEGAMAAPGERLGAHERDWSWTLRGQGQQLLQAGLKLGGLHIVGKAAERLVAPALVGRIGAGVAQAAQAGQVSIVDAGGLQAVGQGFTVELRVTPGAGDGAHIHHPRDAVHVQQVDEFIQRPRRVTDGQYEGLAFDKGCFRQYLLLNWFALDFRSAGPHHMADMAACPRPIHRAALTPPFYPQFRLEAW